MQGFPAGTDTAEQLEAFVEGVGGYDAIAPLAALASPAAPTFTNVTLTSGTPAVNATALKQKYYIGITGGSAGTVGVTVTDTAVSPVTHTIFPVVAANAVASQTLIVDVPAGWSITVTTVTATINANSVVTTGL